MKTLRPIFALAIVTAFLASCSTSNDVVGGVFQKRKYNKGYYWNRSVKQHSADSEKEGDVAVAQNKEIRTLDAKSVTAIETAEKQLVAIAAVTKTEIQKADQQEAKQTVAHTKAPVKRTLKNVIAPVNEKQQVISQKRGKSIAEVMGKKKQAAGSDADAMFILAVIFAILIPPLGVLIYTNIDWKKVLICLLLTILFFLPGMIYALLVVFDVI